MGTQTAWPELSSNSSGLHIIDGRQSKKTCRRGLSIYPDNPPKRLTLPNLPARPASPTTSTESTWDALIPNSNRIIQDVPLSEQSTQDQDAHFSEPGYAVPAVLFAAVNAVRGETSQFVEWDYESMRLKAKPVRMISISCAATTGVLQECADIGSYVRRLRSVVTRIENPQASQVLLALASAIEDEVERIMQLELDSNHVLGLLKSVQEPADMAYLLARVVGCADLSVAAELRFLPSTTHLLNTAYNEMLRVQLEPAKYAVLWKMVGRAIDPWLAQLNRMLGSDPSIFSIPAQAMASDFLPDMFIAQKGSFFVLDHSRLPKFMPTRIAQLAVECLNCGLLLKYLTPHLEQPIAWFSGLQSSPQLGFKSGMSTDPFNPNHLDSQYATPHLFIPQSTPKDPEVAMFALFHPIEQRCSELNAVAIDMLWHQLYPVTLKGHADILINVFCLKNGKLFASLQNTIRTLDNEPDAAKWELAADAVKESLMETIEQLAVPPNCVRFNFRRGRNAPTEAPVTPVYVVSSPSDMIVTPEIVAQATSVFHLLLDLQRTIYVLHQNKKRDELQSLYKLLFDISLEVSRFSRKLEATFNSSDQTLAGIIDAFSEVSTVAANIRLLVGK